MGQISPLRAHRCPVDRGRSTAFYDIIYGAAERHGELLPMGLRNTVNPGDRFAKVETTKIFTVARFADLPHHPPHAVLIGEWQHTGEILISVSALLDSKMYRRVHD